MATEPERTFVTRHQGGRTTGGSDHLSSVPGNQLDIVNRDADGNRSEGQRVPNLGGGVWTAHQLRADLKADGRYNIGLFAVLIFQQGEPGSSARIIFDCRNSCLDS